MSGGQKRATVTEELCAADDRTESAWEAEGWAVPLMPIWPGDVIKLTYWFLWIYECLFHKLYFQTRALFRALSFFPQMDQLCAHIILLPEEPTHTSPICGASAVHTLTLCAHKQTPLFFMCASYAPLPSGPNISDCFLPPGVVEALSPGGV